MVQIVIWMGIRREAPVWQKERDRGSGRNVRSRSFERWCHRRLVNSKIHLTLIVMNEQIKTNESFTTSKFKVCVCLMMFLLMGLVNSRGGGSALFILTFVTYLCIWILSATQCLVHCVHLKFNTQWLLETWRKFHTRTIHSFFGGS